MSALVTLEGKFELHGTWWKSSKPDQKVRGAIDNRDDGALTLRLLGSFGERFWGEEDRQVEDIVLGELENGTYCTLYDTYQTSQQGGMFNRINRATYHAHLMLMGIHLTNLDENVFKSAEFEFDGIRNWGGTAPITGKDSNDSASPFDLISITCRATEIPPIQIEALPAQISVTNLFNSSFSWHSVGVTSRTTIAVTPNELKNFRWFQKYGNQLRNLFSLLIGEPLRFQAFVLAVNNPKNNGDVPIHMYANVFQPPALHSDHHQSMLLPFESIKEQWASIVSSWFGMTEDLKAVHDLYFSPLYKANSFMENLFLDLMAAIEGFHRRRRGGTYMAQDEFDALLPAMLEIIPKSVMSDHRDSLKTRLRFANEYSLRKRIMELWKELSPNSHHVFGKNFARFLDRAVDTRNVLTHVSSKKNSKLISSDGADLFYASWCLRYFLMFMFLKELGIPESQIAESLKKHRVSQHFLLKANDYLELGIDN